MTTASIAHPANLKQPELPVFFLQMGSNTSLFFDKILQQAALSNGRDNVYVLTDTNFHLYQDYTCIDITPYTKVERPFDKLYQHHSTNKYFFEKTCFDRWFIMNELALDLGIPNFVHADCDVLILQDLKPIFRNHIKDKYEGTMMFFEREEGSVTSAHTSFWSNKLLTDFCNFINAKYTDKEAFDVLLKDTLAGKFLDNRNVSDMILLDVFRTENKPSALNLLSLEDKGINIDFNLSAPFNGCKNHYVLTPGTGIKKMIRMADGLYAQVAGNTGQPVYARFYTMHFQGYVTKTLIPLHVTTKSTFEHLTNYVLGKAYYFNRRLRLFRNKVKSIVKNFAGKRAVAV